MRQKVMIIGGGAAGLTGGIFAARQGAQVTILEQMDRAGKKILSTGNGKCNLTNRFLDETCYRSENPSFPYKTLKEFGVEKTLEFFEELGIYVKDKNGYLYPNSEQAAAVSDLLKLEAERQKVSLVCRCRVEGIKKTGKGFLIRTSQGNYQADRVILASGGKAAPVTGSDGSGYVLAQSLGHRLIKPLPALVQLRCVGTYFKQLAGIRTDACVTLLTDQKVLAVERGELQLTDYGISGIPVFQVSRYAAKTLDQGKKVKARIHFLPDKTQKQVEELLGRRRDQMGHKTAEELLMGVFQKKLIAVLLKESGISLSAPAGKLEKRQIGTLAEKICRFETEVVSTNPFENAQVCCGGMDTDQVNPRTMESKAVKGLYLAGEVLDVDGICGGYNLQWAWSSGAIAGIYAGRGDYDKN